RSEPFERCDPCKPPESSKRSDSFERCDPCKPPEWNKRSEPFERCDPCQPPESSKSVFSKESHEQERYQLPCQQDDTEANTENFNVSVNDDKNRHVDSTPSDCNKNRDICEQRKTNSKTQETYDFCEKYRDSGGYRSTIKPKRYHKEDKNKCPPPMCKEKDESPPCPERNEHILGFGPGNIDDCGPCTGNSDPEPMPAKAKNYSGAYAEKHISGFEDHWDERTCDQDEAKVDGRRIKDSLEGRTTKKQCPCDEIPLSETKRNKYTGKESCLPQSEKEGYAFTPCRDPPFFYKHSDNSDEERHKLSSPCRDPPKCKNLDKQLGNKNDAEASNSHYRASIESHHLDSDIRSTTKFKFMKRCDSEKNSKIHSGQENTLEDSVETRLKPSGNVSPCRDRSLQDMCSAAAKIMDALPSTPGSKSKCVEMHQGLFSNQPGMSVSIEDTRRVTVQHRVLEENTTRADSSKNSNKLGNQQDDVSPIKTTGAVDDLKNVKQPSMLTGKNRSSKRHYYTSDINKGQHLPTTSNMDGVESCEPYADKAREKSKVPNRKRTGLAGPSSSAVDDGDLCQIKVNSGDKVSEGPQTTSATCEEASEHYCSPYNKFQAPSIKSPKRSMFDKHHTHVPEKSNPCSENNSLSFQKALNGSRSSSSKRSPGKMNNFKKQKPYASSKSESQKGPQNSSKPNWLSQPKPKTSLTRCEGLQEATNSDNQSISPSPVSLETASGSATDQDCSWACEEDNSPSPCVECGGAPQPARLEDVEIAAEPSHECMHRSLLLTS
ncbi:hypothetical protein EGW08_017950, partial [Elysia chlorotica]